MSDFHLIERGPFTQPGSKASGIYMWQHRRSGKVYVGSSVLLLKRKKAHLNKLRRGSHYNKHLQSAWTKYGEKAFNFIEIELCAEDRLIEREQYWIDYYDSSKNENGYNLSPNAESRLGAVLTEESKERLRTAQRNPEVRNKKSKSQKEAWKDPVRRAKWLKNIRKLNKEKSERQQEAWKDPVRRTKWIASMKESANNPDVRARKSRGMKETLTRMSPDEITERKNHLERLRKNTDVQAKRVMNMQKAVRTPEARNRASNASRETWADKEVRDKRTAGIRRAKQTPESRARTSAASKLSHSRPEVRAKISAASKAAWARRKSEKRVEESYSGE